MITITVDGKSLVAPAGLNLFELLKKSSDISGFCHHPLLKTSQKCLLCTVYDENQGQFIHACQKSIEEGDVYLLEHEKVKEAKRELESIYFNDHKFHCTNCDNQSLCQYPQNFGEGFPRQSGEVELLAKEGEKQNHYRLSDNLHLNLLECIDCGLCSDFERAVSHEPALVQTENGLEVIGGLSHNLGVNLLDLCPTGCFEDKRVATLKTKRVQEDFCRGCDRLCRVEQHLVLGASGLFPIRLSSPKNMAHWLCDEANESFKKSGHLPLSNLLVKREGQWGPGTPDSDLVSLSEGSWHLIVPANLPNEVWECLILNLKKTKNGSNDNVKLSVIEWPNRTQEKELLRQPRNFKQSLRTDLEQLCDLVELVGVSNKENVLLVSPEIIKNQELWDKVVMEVSGYKRKVFAGPSLSYDLYDKVDTLIPLPAYHTLSWSGESYQGEKISVLREAPHFSLFKEQNL